MLDFNKIKLLLRSKLWHKRDKFALYFNILISQCILNKLFNKWDSSILLYIYLIRNTWRKISLIKKITFILSYKFLSSICQDGVIIIFGLYLTLCGKSKCVFSVRDLVYIHLMITRNKQSIKLLFFPKLFS